MKIWGANLGLSTCIFCFLLIKHKTLKTTSKCRSTRFVERAFLFYALKEHKKKFKVKASISIHGSVLLIMQKHCKTPLKTLTVHSKTFWSQNIANVMVIKITHQDEDIVVLIRTIKWRHARSFVLMIGWKNPIFVQAQRFWRSDSDLGKNTVNMALIIVLYPPSSHVMPRRRIPESLAQLST